MKLASGWRMVLAPVAAALICAGCGSSSQPTAQTPVSLQELHGNSLVGATYDFNVGADGRLTVQRLARTVRLTALGIGADRHP